MPMRVKKAKLMLVGVRGEERKEQWEVERRGTEVKLNCTRAVADISIVGGR